MSGDHSEHPRPGSAPVRRADGEIDWDAQYARAERIWSGNPNGALVAEVDGTAPGRVLDVGCGEGADAVWLARQGWQVTALEVSGVALSRAVEHARDAGVQVHWVHSGLEDADLPTGDFDLVSAQYPALRRTADQRAERVLLGAVAVGGTLLVVHHDVSGAGGATGFDPDEFVLPATVAGLLDDDWRVEVDERRNRHVATGAGAGHAHDLVLRARRLR